MRLLMCGTRPMSWNSGQSLLWLLLWKFAALTSFFFYSVVSQHAQAAIDHISRRCYLADIVAIIGKDWTRAVFVVEFMNGTSRPCITTRNYVARAMSQPRRLRSLNEMWSAWWTLLYRYRQAKHAKPCLARGKEDRGVSVLPSVLASKSSHFTSLYAMYIDCTFGASRPILRLRYAPCCVHWLYRRC